MRNRTLHHRLREFAEQAAHELSQRIADSEELAFELVESPGARTPLYCFRPLTEQFIHERMADLKRLPACGQAQAALAGLAGTGDYLRLRGEPRPPAPGSPSSAAVLQAFLTAIFHERSDFELCEERFESAYTQLEAAVYERRQTTSVIAAVYGLAITSVQVPLDEGLSLVRGDTLEDVPAEAVWSGPRRGAQANVLAVVTVPAGHADPLETARERFARLLTALRLADAGTFALSGMGWMRADAGAWQLVTLAGAPAVRRSERPMHVEAEQEDELRGFCNLVAKRAGSLAPGEVAWALARFEAGCDDLNPLQALTDHLLALRALLEPEGPSSGRVAQRVAAICGSESERPLLAERMARAISLERAVIGGLAPAHPEAEDLVDEVAHHLRSLLRDVLCGHLQPDLVAVADGILADAVTGESPAAAYEPADEDDLEPWPEVEPGEAPLVAH